MLVLVGQLASGGGGVEGVSDEIVNTCSQQVDCSFLIVIPSCLP